MRTITSCAAILLAASLSACASTQATSMATLPDAAAEAAFRHVFANNASGLQSRAAAYCIGIGQGSDLRDPSQTVLASLADVGKVAPASTCRVSTGVTNSAGQRALLFSVDAVECAEDRCIVRAGYYEGNVSAQVSEYTLRRSNGRWAVDSTATVGGPIA